MNRTALVSATLAALLVATGCCPPIPRATGPDPIAEPTPNEPEPTPIEPEPTPAAPPVAWDAAGIDWSAVPAPWPETPFTAPVPVTFKLACGLAVVLVENHRLPLVSVRVIAHEGGTRFSRETCDVSSRSMTLKRSVAVDLQADS